VAGYPTDIKGREKPKENVTMASPTEMPNPTVSGAGSQLPIMNSFG
jgi:hypothetical protein